jgi:hypothetical protein
VKQVSLFHPVQTRMPKYERKGEAMRLLARFTHSRLTVNHLQQQHLLLFLVPVATAVLARAFQLVPISVTAAFG